MTRELTYLAWTLVLGMVQLGAAALAKRAQEPPLWAAGSRDEGEPRYTGLAARLMRAQSNLMETLPLFVAAVLLVHAAGRDGSLSAWGCALYFWSRLVFVPLYALGIPFWRTIVWIGGTVGLCLVMAASLMAA